MRVVKLRLTAGTSSPATRPFADFDAVFATRLAEADAFYESVIPAEVLKDKDRANVMRQALAGMLWTKQYFYYDLDLWLDEHGAGAHLPAHERKLVRNSAGRTCTTTTSSRCRTSGSTRGTRPGTWRST